MATLRSSVRQKSASEVIIFGCALITGRTGIYRCGWYGGLACQWKAISGKTVTAMAEYPQREYIVRETEYPMGYTKEEEVCELVRCKDCKFFSHGYCRFHDAKFVRPDGYCYWGEQKEGEQHD